MERKPFRVAGLVLIILLAIVPWLVAQEVTIESTADKGGKIMLPAILHKPAGDGPFPAIVMLSGCGGYSSPQDAQQQGAWVERLEGWGYVALQVDSFTPRGSPSVCDNPARIGPLTRSYDAYAAKAYLASLPFVDADNVGVIGWSHGGWTIMTVIDKFYRDKSEKPFKVAVAFYPFCTTPADPDTPVRVLIGRKDTWCPASYAESVQRDYKRNNWKSEFLLTVYPNATHAFDFLWPKGGIDFSSYHMEYDPEATADAIVQAKDFLARYLKSE
jgi:dienelactone hydrolase